jgi:hypothetical protein
LKLGKNKATLGGAKKEDRAKPTAKLPPLPVCPGNADLTLETELSKFVRQRWKRGREGRDGVGE